MWRSAAHVDRGTDRQWVEEDLLAVGFHVIVVKTSVEKGERVVRHLALAFWIKPKSAKLGRHPARSDPQAQASPGQFLDRCHPLRGGQRGTEGHINHPTAQTN